MGHRTWIYHKTEQPKIIDSDERDKYFEDGWDDSPAKFISLKDFDIDPDDAIAVQNLGETVQGIVDAMNGALNLDEMEASEIKEYAHMHFGKEVDVEKDIEELRVEVRAMIDGKKAEVIPIIKKMKAPALVKYAKDKFGQDLDKKLGVKVLRVEVQAMIDGNSE